MIPVGASRRQVLKALGAGLALPGAARAVAVDSRLLVGFPPGGTADVLARALVQGLPAGAAPLVENKPGAGGRLAVIEMLRRPADGRTLLITADPILVIYPHAFRKPGYDTLADVLPVAPLAAEPVGLVIGPMVPASVTTLAGFVDWCRAHPKDAAYATAAAGTTMHFVGSMLAKAEQLDLLHVPHRGGAAAVQDVMGGQIASTITSMSQVVPMLPDARLRPLALSGPTRSARLPEVPTFAELGHPSIQALVYYGSYVRAGTPPAVLGRWHDAVQGVAATPAFTALLGKLALDPMTMSQPDFAARVRADHAHWAPVVQASGYRADE